MRILASSLLLLAIGCGGTAMAQHSLSVTASGPGGVTSDIGNITCRTTTCSASFDQGKVVVLTAHPDTNASFGGWSGACTGFSLTCTITLGGADSSATASFLGATSAGTHALTVTVTGSGSVQSSPPGINCPTHCTASFADGTAVVLTPSGGSLTGWSGGGCSGTGNCSVTISADAAVTAAFTTPSNTHNLTVQVSGNGSVTSTPAGISCPQTSCSAAFSAGAAVTLSQTPDSGQTFSGWSGGNCSGTGNCVVTLGADTTVTATFTSPGY
jgi:hypothetical protein